MSIPYPSWLVDKTAEAIYAVTYPGAADTYHDPELVQERGTAIRQAYAAIDALQKAGYFATPAPSVPQAVRDAFGRQS